MRPLRLPCDVGARVVLLESTRLPIGTEGVVVVRDLEDRGRDLPGVAWRLVAVRYIGGVYLAWVRLDELGELGEDGHEA